MFDPGDPFEFSISTINLEKSDLNVIHIICRSVATKRNVWTKEYVNKLSPNLFWVTLFFCRSLVRVVRVTTVWCRVFFGVTIQEIVKNIILSKRKIFLRILNIVFTVAVPPLFTYTNSF